MQLCTFQTKFITESTLELMRDIKWLGDFSSGSRWLSKKRSIDTFWQVE